MRHKVRRLYVDGPAAEFLPPEPPVVNVRAAAADSLEVADAGTSKDGGPLTMCPPRSVAGSLGACHPPRGPRDRTY